MQVKNLTCLGRATAGLPASAPGDLMRLAEVVVLLSGTAPLVHAHGAAAITDLATAVTGLVVNLLQNSGSVSWVNANGTLTALVQLKANGGVLADEQGLFLDSSAVSQPGHPHVAADITDFSTAFTSSLTTALLNGSTVQWQVSGTNLIASVALATGGALVDTGNGLAVSLGTSATQAAAGNHTHTLLHPPTTLQPSSSLVIAIDGSQCLSAEVRLAAGGGLVLNSGVGADFGTGHSQVARGDHLHPTLAPSFTVGNTASLGLSYNGSLISGTVNLDPNPGPNCGLLGTSSAGLYVQLGSGTQQSARGDHGHSAATSVAAGFMSSADKIKLDALNGGQGVAASLTQASLLIVLDGAGQPIPTGLYEYVVMPYAGTITGWDLIGLPAGTLAVDIYKGAFASLPLGSGQSITLGNKPTVNPGTGVSKAQVSGLNWAFAAGDVLGFNVDSCAVVKRATLGLRLTKT